MAWNGRPGKNISSPAAAPLLRAATRAKGRGMKRTGMGAAVAAAVWLWQGTAALACEGCKQAIKGPNGEEQLSAASIGYGWSVSFMLLMTFSVIGSLVWMIFRSCQTLSRAHAAAEAACREES